MDHPLLLAKSGDRNYLLINENSLEKSVNDTFYQRRAHVSRVIVNGIVRTKTDVVKNALDSLLRSHNYGDLLIEISRFKEQLEQCQCFNEVNMHLDTMSTRPDDEGILLTVDVQEKRYLSGSGQLSAGNVDGNVQIGGMLSNFAGRGESFGFDCGYNTNHVPSLDAVFRKPYLRRTGMTELSVHAYKSGGECQYSSWRQDVLGTMLKFHFRKRRSRVNHYVTWKGEFRSLTALDSDTPFEIRKYAAHSMKSSIAHEILADTRPRAIFPTGGTYLNIVNELAGFGGNIGFFKHESKIQTNFSLKSLLFQLNYNYGFLVPFEQDSKKIEVNDQFFVGGPILFRGFQTKGVGNHLQGARIGNNMYYLLSAHLFTPLPFQPRRFKTSDAFKLHFFSTVGSVQDKFLNDDTSNVLSSLFAHSRASLGVGFAFKFASVLQIELNYCWPFFVQEQDQPVRGLQFGFNFHRHT